MTPERPRARKGEGDRLREEILEAAEALLLETGSDEAVSIRAVADRVGVTPPSIYRHFTDKSTLIFEVSERQFERFQEFLAAGRSAHDDPLEAVKACARAYVEFGLASPEHYRIMFMGREDMTPEEYRNHMLADDTSFTALVRAVEACRDAGYLKGDAFETATLMWTTVHGVTSLLISKPNFPWPPVDVLVDQMLDMVGHGVFVDPGG